MQTYIYVKLTLGNIRNNYIRIKQFNGLMSKEEDNGENPILLELTGVGKIKTYIDKKKGILTERKSLKQFFNIHNLQPGDSIIIEKAGDKHFNLKPDQIRKDEKKGKDSQQKESETDIKTTEENQVYLFDTQNKKTRIFKTKRLKSARRCNELSGAEWTASSISVWKDIFKTKIEKRLEHPAMFPTQLINRIIRCFTTSSEKMILDPFMGSGASLVAACSMGRTGIGFEVYEDYVELANQRLKVCMSGIKQKPGYYIFPYDARKLDKIIEHDTIDLCITSPPYWDILTRKRTADYKKTRDYGNSSNDLGRISDYNEFLTSLGEIFSKVIRVLKPGKYCVVNVMDLRKGSRFYPFHSDLMKELTKIGFIFDDLIIWDRSHEYNNLRPLGYPSVFRINKVHEYLLIFQKPKTEKSAKYGKKNKNS